MLNNYASYDGDDWTFTVSLDSKVNENEVNSLTVPLSIQESFQSDGFVTFPNVLSQTDVNTLNDHIERVLRGHYDRAIRPDKTPKLVKYDYAHRDENYNDSKGTKSSARGPLGFSGNLQNVKVLQVINVHKCDSFFRQLATSPVLGQVVAELAGWSGARLAQDQVWAKPPFAPALSFHRDSPYFMFEPNAVVTVWVALDDMDEEIGPLEYVVASHRWGQDDIGVSSQFFHGGRSLLDSAAAKAGIDAADLKIVSMAGLRAGGISIHDGRMWHGSPRNQSRTRPRRGLGLHYVPDHVRFTSSAVKSRLWRPYVEHTDDASTVELPNEDFPVVYRKRSTIDCM